ncbi:MAG: YceI family protein [Sphingobacteriales bacterium]|jgi:polyisoprenoid-binding protein YceI
MCKSLYLFPILLLPIFLIGQTKLRANKQESTISYTMKHALHEWTGVSKDVNCIMETDANGTAQKVAVVVKVSSFDSKNSNRDSHMIEVTEGLSFPNITFSSSSITPNGQGKYKVAGKLSFHGVEKPVEFMMTEEKKDNKRFFNGSFQILIEDYKIERPSLMFVKTDNEVIIKMNVAF